MATAPMVQTVSTFLRAAAIALSWSLSLVAAAAQQPPPPPGQQGQPVAELPRWSQWLQGEPLVLGSEGAPPVTVVVDHAAAPHRAAFAGDGDCFADLARRFGPRGLAVVALVAAAPANGLEHWVGCRIAVDADAAAARHWRLGDGRGSVVVLDARGELVFQGSPDGGVVDAIEAVLAANGAQRDPGQLRRPRWQQRRAVAGARTGAGSARWADAGLALPCRGPQAERPRGCRTRSVSPVTRSSSARPRSTPSRAERRPASPNMPVRRGRPGEHQRERKSWWLLLA